MAYGQNPVGVLDLATNAVVPAAADFATEL
jgi:hypothetical protein